MQKRNNCPLKLSPKEGTKLSSRVHNGVNLQQYKKLGMIVAQHELNRHLAETTR